MKSIVVASAVLALSFEGCKDDNNGSDSNGTNTTSAGHHHKHKHMDPVRIRVLQTARIDSGWRLEKIQAFSDES